MNRSLLVVLFVVAALILLSLSRFGGAFESILYTGYSLAIPFMFLLMIVGGVYFGAKHLLTS
jgi:hypothetical protein